ncbi:MAG: Ldh family oxidoreductase [Anaerolineae bacterium]|nr:Ldh family oxidoreductase [Anaerolineae bacterium]MCX8066364.1 Ldh family oxidoreductase [Anaerolineae bacterium]MDW7992191.1 Ldh family oxidoreductase [Anaerolineae bacterium]
MAENTVLIPAEVLREACRRILEKVGVPPDQAHIIADVTVEADMRGVGSHGVLRLSAYVHRVQAGLMAANTQLRVVRERGATVLLDAQGGFGQVAGVHAMNLAIERARQHGVGLVAVRNANHFGIAAYYTMMALPHRMVGIAASNAAPSMAAWGGTTAVLGTNPVSVAIPTGQDVDIVLDMASSVVARGKIRAAAAKGERIPLGWALDAEGRPTEDPQAALKGTLAPIGGPKGYGLALVVDALAGVLTGSDYSIYLASLHDLSRRASVGFVMQAVDVAAFSEWETYVERMRSLVDVIRNSPRAPGVDRIYLPGEIEGLKRQEAERSGVPVAVKVLEELRALAAELGVPVDLPAA